MDVAGGGHAFRAVAQRLRLVERLYYDGIHVASKRPYVDGPMVFWATEAARAVRYRVENSPVRAGQIVTVRRDGAEVYRAGARMVSS